MQVYTGPPRPSDGPRTTTRYMTKYERARILGTRALQIRCVEVHAAVTLFLYSNHGGRPCTCSRRSK